MGLQVTKPGSGDRQDFDSAVTLCCEALRVSFVQESCGLLRALDAGPELGATMASAAASYGGIETLAAILSHPAPSVAIAAAAAIDAAFAAMLAARQRDTPAPGSDWPRWVGEVSERRLPWAPSHGAGGSIGSKEPSMEPAGAAGLSAPIGLPVFAQYYHEMGTRSPEDRLQRASRSEVATLIQEVVDREGGAGENSENTDKSSESKAGSSSLAALQCTASAMCSASGSLVPRWLHSLRRGLLAAMVVAVSRDHIQWILRVSYSAFTCFGQAWTVEPVHDAESQKTSIGS